MLERKHRCRREDGHLFRIGDGFECGAHRHFRLAVAHVAAEQAIHRQIRFHIALHVFDGALLVGSFLEFESVVEFASPIGVRRKGVADGRFSLGVEFQKLIRHVADGFLHARLARFPNRGAQAVELRLDAAERLYF